MKSESQVSSFGVRLQFPFERLLISVHEFISPALIHRHDMSWYAKVIRDLVLSYASVVYRFRITFLLTLFYNFKLQFQNESEVSSLYEMHLQGIMVIVFIILDWMFILRNTTSMIPCRRVLQWDAPLRNHGSCIHHLGLDVYFDEYNYAIIPYRHVSQKNCPLRIRVMFITNS